MDMKTSAGILVYRKKDATVEVLLVHPGGPFWAKKDDHAWSIPKGEYQEGEDPLTVAKREFKEEIGQTVPSGDLIELGTAKLGNSKVVSAWAVEGDLDASNITSNTFTIEWPPRSGKQQEFPEVDRAEWYDLSTASHKVHPGLNDFLKRLAGHLKVEFADESATPHDGELSSQQVSLL
jgi:predicted NUDIX family NTP pyrophosphohydrolase